MRNLPFSEAVDDALGQAMARDERIVVFGEDVPMLRRNLMVRFGPKRVRGAPISESAFVGAAVAASMAGLRPVVEVYMADFLAVAMDALLNHAPKVEHFSGGKWNAPVVIRASCGGGYGDGGQHEQALWGWMAHIPGLSVLVPSTPADAGGLMMGALKEEGPVLFLEHKLLSASWLEFLGSGGRGTVEFDVPDEGAWGPVPDSWKAIPVGQAVNVRAGKDLTLVSVGLGVHRAIAAAGALERERISAAVLDLRSVAPLDGQAILHAARKTGRVLVVDEDYQAFGLSGEVAAVIMEAGIDARFGRVCTRSTIPYARHLEEQVLPNVSSIVRLARELMEADSVV